MVDVAVVDFILGGMLSELENLGGQTVALLNGAQLTISSERPITGIQIKLSENTLVSNSTNLAMAYRENQIILYSADGQYIQGNNIPVLEFNTDVLIEDIIIVDNLGQRISAVLVWWMKVWCLMNLKFIRTIRIHSTQQHLSRWM